MKKIIILISILIFISFKVRAEDKFVLVEIADMDNSLISLPVDGFNIKDNLITSNDLSKKECENLVDSIISEERKNNNIVGNNYVYLSQGTVRQFNFYFCIPKSMWFSMKENDNWDFARDKGGNIISRDTSSFFEAVKKCGLDKIDYNHFPIVNTPLICDKYSEENPVPVVASDDFWDIKKEASQNKQNFDEALREFLKKKE